MSGCEGEGCLRRDVCERYWNRLRYELLSRVLCRQGEYPWFILRVKP